MEKKFILKIGERNQLFQKVFSICGLNNYVKIIMLKQLSINPKCVLKIPPYNSASDYLFFYM